MKNITRLGSALLAMALVAACSASGGAEDASSNDTDGGALTVNLPTGPSSLDPARTCSLYYDHSVGRQVYSTLLRYGTKAGPDGTEQVDPATVEPYIAEDWDVSADGLTYTFHIRDDVEFLTGNPLTAEAVKYSFDRTIGMAGCSSYTIQDGFIDPPLIESVEAPDKDTVVITLSQPDPNALLAWAYTPAIVEPAVVEENGGYAAGEINEWMESNIAGVGPFILESYSPGASAVLVRNPDFFYQPTADEIRINYVDSDSTLLLQARSGAADVTLGLSKRSLKDLEGSEGVRVVATDGPVFEQIALVNTKPPFDNRTFREALTYAVPYEDILKEVVYGYGSLFYGPLPPQIPGYDESISAPRTYDLDQAQQLIDDSGVQTPVDVTITVTQGQETDKQVATIVQGEWAKLGVNVTIDELSLADYTTALQEDAVQAFIRLSGPGAIEAGYYLGYDMKCGIAQNFSRICIEEADALLDKFRVEPDPEARQDLLNQITELWRAESPKIMVYADKYGAALSDDVTNYTYSHILDMSRWSVS